MKELKPCPFCGGSNLEIASSPTNPRLMYIRCKSDACPYGSWSNKVDRDTGWNTRPIEDSLQKRVEELEKEKAELQKSANYCPEQKQTDHYEERMQKIREIIKDVLENNELLYCSKVWEAWSYGTMGESDFRPAEEDDDIVESFAKAIFCGGAFYD